MAPVVALARREGDDVGADVEEDREEGRDPARVDEGRRADDAREDRLGAGEGRLRVARVDVARGGGRVPLVGVDAWLGGGDLLGRRVAERRGGSAQALSEESGQS